MSKTAKPAAAQAAGADARFEVKLNKRFSYMGFDYMPGHEHDVDKVTHDAMVAAEAVADVKQLS